MKKIIDTVEIIVEGEKIILESTSLFFAKKESSIDLNARELIQPLSC
jgi:hypothetical protein